MSTSDFIIYGLVDPRDGQLRYIGQSSRGLRRPREHVFPSEIKRRVGHKSNWIKYLISLGLTYEIVIIQEFDSADILPQAEIFWISYFRTMGCNLTNATDGGEAFRGYRHTAESREKIRLASTGRKLSPETKARLSTLATGRHHTQATKDKLSALKAGVPTGLHNQAWLGKKHSEETKAKMSSSMKGIKRSPEGRRNISNARRTLTDDQELEVVSLYYTTSKSYREIGDLFGMKKLAIRSLLKRRIRTGF